MHDAIQLVEAARALGIEARVAGSVAVLIQARTDLGLRPTPPKDLDIVAYTTARQAIQTFLQTPPMNWSLARELLFLVEDRETYCSVKNHYSLDVYYGSIDGNHRIALDGRLELSFPTIEWTDLLLSKLQRVRPRPEDLWDCCALLRMGTSHLDVNRVVFLLGRDWGLYTTVADNLCRLQHEFPVFTDTIHEIRRTMQHAPKRLSWRLRSMVGRRVKWWRDIYNVGSPSHLGGE